MSDSFVCADSVFITKCFRMIHQTGWNVQQSFQNSLILTNIFIVSQRVKNDSCLIWQLCSFGVCQPCYGTIVMLSKTVWLIITRLCNKGGREWGLSYEFVCVLSIFIHVFFFFLGRHPCWLRLSRYWPSCWVGRTLCCPSQGSVISGRRWCLLGWPPDSTDTHWTVWQVRQTLIF